MSEPKIFWYERSELNDPIALVGFPSIGLVGSIITSYIARTLNMKVVAGATPTDTQQYTLIQNGTPYPPVRIYAGPIHKKRKKKAKPAEGTQEEMPPEKSEAPKKRVKARDLIILTSELAPKPEQTYDFTVAMIDIVRELGATDIIFIDGIARMDQNTAILGAYTSDKAKAMLEEAGITLMSDGLVRGMSGVGLFQSKVDGLDAMCLIAPANPQLPDPRAAASILIPLSKIVPRFDVDPQPLIQEAQEIEDRLRSQQASQQPINHNIYR
ncbi:MAG: PAC2 family protein [Methanomethylophilus sp.]|nr:PAC2 family protein [Methanomethylophilus sp.]